MNSFKDRLNEAISRTGITKAELSRRSGIGRNSITDYTKGKYEAKQDKAYLLAKALNVDPAWLLGYNVPVNKIEELSKVFNRLEPDRQNRVLVFASSELADQNKKIDLAEHPRTYIAGRSTAAGAPIDGDTQDSSATVVRSADVPNGADELVTIAGDSMEPLLAKGSQVFIHWQPVVENGEIAVVSIEDDGVTCKKFYLEGDKIRLVSLNEAYQDMIFDREKIRVIGKVL